MREILFRAKRIDNGEWVEGYYLKTTLGKDIEPSDVIFVPFKINRSGQWGWIKVFSETLCQYTGMVDKNGNRIWENDIVKHEISGIIGTVKWYEEDYVGWCVDDVYVGKQQSTNEMWSECEVIGNVFDDKHLLADTDYCWEQEKETED